MALYIIPVACHIEIFKRHKNGIVYFVSLLGFLVFVGCGALAFRVIEADQFEESQKAVLVAKDQIRKKYPQVSDEALEEFLDELRIIGIRGLPQKNNTIIKWTFADAWFFVTTLLTTVGYGHFTPKTQLGKVFCLVYTSIGIPLTLMHLAYYVNKLIQFSEILKLAIFRQFRRDVKPHFLRFLHAAILMTLIVMICFILPGAFFSCMEENWGLFDGIYFCFISLTTVGLGDLVPAMNPNMPYADLYKFATSFYLFIGLFIILFMMTMMADYCKNYNRGYEQLPTTIPTEKFPINPGTVHTYGSILTNSGKSEADGKDMLLPK